VIRKFIGAGSFFTNQEESFEMAGYVEINRDIDHQENGNRQDGADTEKYPHRAGQEVDFCYI
jgi:hypothetical protein